MPTTRVRLVLAVCAALLIFAVGFFCGGVYASTRALRAATGASLIYFTGIHDALARQEYERAASFTNLAVDGHIGVLSQLSRWPRSAASFYVLPWGFDPEMSITSIGIAHVRKSYMGQSDLLQPATRAFLDAQPVLHSR